MKHSSCILSMQQGLAEKERQPTEVDVVAPLQIQDRLSPTKGRVYRSRRLRRHPRRRMNSRTPERNRWQRRTRYHSEGGLDDIVADDARKRAGGEKVDGDGGQKEGEKGGGTTPFAEVSAWR